jgi:ribosomal protein S18 acetylase RimI-like enzyme
MAYLGRFLLLHITRNYALRGSGTLLTDGNGGHTLVAPMNCDDADALSSVFGQILQSLPYYNQRAKTSEMAKYTPAKLKASVLGDPESVLVAKIRNQIVGLCFSHEDDDLIWLAWIGVHPSHQRKGVASVLLGTLVERAKRSASHKIWCDSRTDNDAAKALFSYHGYSQLCTIRNHWYGQDFILWEKLVG